MQLDDAEVVPCADLSPYISKAILEFNAEHDAYPRFREPDDIGYESIGVFNWMEQETGIPQRTIRRIWRGDFKHTSLDNADKLLHGLGFTYALSNGSVRVVPNPMWSQEKWISFMQERGCEPTDY